MAERRVPDGGVRRGAPTAIRVERLAKSYGAGPSSTPALSDVTFEVGAGETLALLGPNGAGKSTTINILATLITPDAGTAVVGGEDVTRCPHAVRRVLGVALEDTGLPNRQTARRLLRHHGRLHGLDARETGERVEEIVDVFGLRPVADRVITTYSTGERRRLHLALALFHRPRVMLLDEPTTGLDMVSRRAIWRALESSVAQGSTLLFTTHDLHEADAHAERVAIIDRGRLVAHGRTRELKRAFGSSGLMLSFTGEEAAQRAVSVLTSARLVGRVQAMIPGAGADGMVPTIRLLDAEGITTRSATMVEPTLASVFEAVTADRDGLSRAGGSGR